MLAAALIALAEMPDAAAVQVHAEQAKGRRERAMWVRLARQLGAAAVFGAVALLPVQVVRSTELNGGPVMHYAKLRALARRLLAARHGIAPTPLLA